MFKVELDLELRFVPPMAEYGQGITVTRTLELPLAPGPDLMAWSARIDDCTEPDGYHLGEFTCDVDR